MMPRIGWVCLALAASAALAEEPEGAAPRRLFHSGFEGEVRVAPGTWTEQNQLQHLEGTDGQTGDDWRRTWQETGLVSNAFFQYVIGPQEAAETWVTTALREMPGRHGDLTRVLYLGVKGNDPGTQSVTRNELNLLARPAWRQAYGRYWLFMHPDLDARAGESTWVMVMEWKEPRDVAAATGGTNNWRANVTLRREDDGRLAWYFLRQQVQPERRDEQLIVNRAVPVPIGRWCEVEVFWRWGAQGRVWFAIDGATVFDERGRFEHATNPLGLKFWAPFKNYRGASWFDADLSNGDEVWFAYDDFEVWTDFPPEHPMRERETLVEESFDGAAPTRHGVPPAGWWFEGEGSGARVRVQEGRLWIDAAGGKGQAGTAWLRTPIAGDLRVSFDVHVVRAIDEVNNMNLFLGYRDASGQALEANAAGRDDGAYRRYHGGALEGTILTFLADEEQPEVARVRVRQVPPFGRLLAEARGYHARAGHTYRVEVERRGRRLVFSVDGERLLHAELPAEIDPAVPGHLGFRTWQTEVWWDNLLITQP